MSDKTEFDKIRALSDREKAREKLPVFFGSRSNTYHGILEVIANGLDEMNNNFNSGTLVVNLYDDERTIEIVDTGRGIPIDKYTDGIPNYELLFRTLFAGGKYEASEQNNTGTNGVGLTVLNFTSSVFEVESCYDEKIHTISFENGGEIKEPLKSMNFEEYDQMYANRQSFLTPESPKPIHLANWLKKCSNLPNNVNNLQNMPKTILCKTHGTKILLKLDEEMYTSVRLQALRVQEISKNYSVVCNKITILCKTNGIISTYNYESIVEAFEQFIPETSRTSKIQYLPLASYSDDNETTKIEVVLSTSILEESIHMSYLNATHLKEHGSIHDGVISAIRNHITKYCKTQKIGGKTPLNITTRDIEDSVSYITSCYSNVVEFEGQTKFSTQKKLYRKIASNHTDKLLEFMFVENPAEYKKLVDHIIAVSSSNGVNLKARTQIKKKLSEKIKNSLDKPEGLIDCKNHGVGSELYISEGASALGSIILSRDPMFQAATAIRGKIMNVLKWNIMSIMKSETILGLIKIMGCGVQSDKKNKDLDNFNIDNLRYEKIFIACDADSDGKQIQILLLVFFWKFMRPVVEAGKIYLCETPLYEVKMKSGEMVYLFSEKDKQDRLPSLESIGVKSISRCKGLGELDAEVFAEVSLNPETRRCSQVTVDDIDKAHKALVDWMGDAVDARKEFISKDLNKYI